MTSEVLANGRVRFTFEQDEVLMFQNLLMQLVESYQGEPKSEAAKRYWAGQITTSEATEENGLQDAQEMLAEARMELRAERADLSRSWLERFRAALQDPFVFELKPSEREEFVAMLNDRRLTLAAEADLTDAEIQTRKTSQLPAVKRAAMREVDILGTWIFFAIGEQYPR